MPPKERTGLVYEERLLDPLALEGKHPSFGCNRSEQSLFRLRKVAEPPGLGSESAVPGAQLLSEPPLTPLASWHVLSQPYW